MQGSRRKVTAIGVVTALIIAVIGLTWYINLPSTQTKLGQYIAELFSSELGTEVRLGKFCYSFPNTFSLKGLTVEDQQGRNMFEASHAEASLDVISLLASGAFNLSELSVSGVKTLIIEDGSYNFQFIIDSLTTPASDTKTKLSISQCDIEILDARYLSMRQNISSKVEKSVITFHNITSANNQLGLTMEQLRCQSFAYKDSCHKIQSKDIWIAGDISIQNTQAELTAKIHRTSLCVEKRPCVIKGLEVSVKDDIVSIQTIDITSKDYITLKGNGTYDTKQDKVKATIETRLSPKLIHDAEQLVGIDENTKQYISRLGTLAFNGNIEGLLKSRIQDCQLVEEGTITSDLGELETELSLAKGAIELHACTDKIKIGTLIGDDQLKSMSMNADAKISVDDLLTSGNHITLDIPSLEYGDKYYRNLQFDGTATEGMIDGYITVDDPAVSLDSKFSFRVNPDNLTDLYDISLGIDLDASERVLSQFMDGSGLNHVVLSMDTQLSNTDLRNMTGVADIHQLTILGWKKPIDITNGQITIDLEGTHGRLIHIDTDIIDATLYGVIDPVNVNKTFCSQLSHHLPTLTSTPFNSNNNFSFDVSIRQSSLLSDLLSDTTITTSPVRVTGNIDSPNNILNMTVSAPSFENSDIRLKDITAMISSDKKNMRANIKGHKVSDNDDFTIKIDATAHDDKVTSLIDILQTPDNNIEGMIYAETCFSRNNDNIQTDITLQPSDITLKGEQWHLQPSSITLYDGVTQISHLGLQSADRYIKANGRISHNLSDTISTDFNGFDIATLQDLLNFHPVKFGGNMSGHATISQLLDIPEISATVEVDSFLFQDGYLGKAKINVGWDTNINGVIISADILDNPAKSAFTTTWPTKRSTTVRGYVAPGEIRDDIQLTITADNTSAKFIHGFLSGVFRDVRGDVNGVMRVTTGSDGVNLIGNMSVDADVQVRATDIVYHINGKDSVNFVPNAFEFHDVQITDAEGNKGFVNGKITHRKLRGLGYSFNIDFKDLLVYDEKEFNSDKFLATAHGTGNLTINGKDGYYTNLVANLTPSKGCIFAYDAATPDAISKGQFVTFRSRKKLSETSGDTMATTIANIKPIEDYSSDLVFDINIHMTPDCALMLRMDNHDDGYITAYGTGEIKARYHNKNPFTLNGIYNIKEGKYRLYLQDIIYRDLLLQPNSNVSFNGNPFDADIHLICRHTLPSVPLRDLTSSVEFVQNSSVKVLCDMDITGKLGDMDFGFNIELPNVSDETRQMVRSLISTEEEMNMQMIYLLSLGRFYTNEIARAQGKTGTGSEMSSLVSSTISGQINNMIGNMVGDDSNWNFGTGLSTGEKGWNNLDVEGSLSGHLLNDRLLINGSFGYRDNSLTNKSNFIGDFDIKYKVFPNRNIYLKGYNQTNDKYFTKSTLTTQGLGISIQKDFDSFSKLFHHTSSTLSNDSINKKQ